MKPLRLDGRVAVVTGAGQGLGRSHALALAQRGAQVLVNDVEADAAAAVAADIRRAGGRAVAQVGSVLEGVRIVEAALAELGRIDIVVNNAGILRDAAFHKMTDAQWRSVLDVHLSGAFTVTRAAWPHLREQGWGRVIMTTSIAGLYGNFGQANYAAAKMGLLGLAQTLAVEGAERDIRVNTIAPLASSRLTQGVMPTALFDALSPDQVTPLVVLLASAACPVTGALFEAAGGRFARLRWERSKVVSISPTDEAAPESLLRDWQTLQLYDGNDHPVHLEDGLDLPNRAMDVAGEGEHHG